MSILAKMFDIPLFGRVIKSVVVKHTGHQQESKILREYTSQKYKVDVGMYSYGSCFSKDFNRGGVVSIGRYCSLAADVHYFGANHPLKHVSTSPYFYEKKFGFDVKDVPRCSLRIGNDVWCGYGVIITNGCHSIGNGAVVAAGAVVTHDVPPYAVVAGSPARIVHYRFDDKTIRLLEESKWWERSPSELMEYYNDISNPLVFCQKLGSIHE